MKMFIQIALLVVVTGLLIFGTRYWLEQQGATASVLAPPALPVTMQDRVALVTAKGCPACHSLDGQAGVGPSWFGVWGQTREFTDGSSVIFDEGYFRESTRDPGARVLKGFQNVMIPAELNEQEAGQVLMLIQELGKPMVR